MPIRQIRSRYCQVGKGRLTLVALCLMILTATAGTAAVQEDEPAGAASTAAPPAKVETTLPVEAHDQDSDDSGERATGTSNSGYTPPEATRAIEEGEIPRPLLAAVREVGDRLRQKDWGNASAQELGYALFGRFDQVFQKETITMVVDSFVEGYNQVYINLPEAIFLTAMDMGSAEAAEEYFHMEVDNLQMTLDIQNQHEDASTEVLSEGELTLENLDHVFEKQYQMIVGDLPPSRFHALFGRAGRYMLVVTLLQSDVPEDTARTLMNTLGGRVRTVETDPAGEQAAAPATDEPAGAGDDSGDL